VTNLIDDPRVTGKDGRISKAGKRGRRDLALSLGTRRHGSAVQGDATSWYYQTAGDLNDLRASPVGHRRKLLAAFTALRSDIGLVPARPSAASTIESACVRDGANQFAEKIAAAAGDLSCRRGE
jgi:hypothetical protein